MVSYMTDNDRIPEGHVVTKCMIDVALRTKLEQYTPARDVGMSQGDIHSIFDVHQGEIVYAVREHALDDKLTMGIPNVPNDTVIKGLTSLNGMHEMVEANFDHHLKELELKFKEKLPDALKLPSNKDEVVREIIRNLVTVVGYARTSWHKQGEKIGMYPEQSFALSVAGGITVPCEKGFFIPGNKVTACVPTKPEKEMMQDGKGGFVRNQLARGANPASVGPFLARKDELQFAKRVRLHLRYGNSYGIDVWSHILCNDPRQAGKRGGSNRLIFSGNAITPWISLSQKFEKLAKVFTLDTLRWLGNNPNPADVLNQFKTWKSDDLKKYMSTRLGSDADDVFTSSQKTALVNTVDTIAKHVARDICSGELIADNKTWTDTANPGVQTDFAKLIANVMPEFATAISNAKEDEDRFDLGTCTSAKTAKLGATVDINLYK